MISNNKRNSALLFACIIAHAVSHTVQAEPVTPQDVVIDNAVQTAKEYAALAVGSTLIWGGFKGIKLQMSAAYDYGTRYLHQSIADLRTHYPVLGAAVQYGEYAVPALSLAVGLRWFAYGNKHIINPIANATRFLQAIMPR
jgi:hypothetical protein